MKKWRRLGSDHANIEMKDIVLTRAAAVFFRSVYYTDWYVCGAVTTRWLDGEATTSTLTWWFKGHILQVGSWHHLEYYSRFGTCIIETSSCV